MKKPYIVCHMKTVDKTSDMCYNLKCILQNKHCKTCIFL